MAIAMPRVPLGSDEGVEGSGEIWSLTFVSFFYIKQMGCYSISDILVELLLGLP
jgi:hypothetical protein